MSDSEDSTVTYTVVSSPFGGLSHIGSPRVNGPPMMPEDPYAYVVAAFQAPPFPDYVSGPKYPHSPDFVPEPVYPEFMPPEDEVLLAEEQPLPAAVLPIADSPVYVPESDPEEDPKEDDDEDPEEDPVDYPANGGDDGDDEDESSDDDEDDDVDIEGDEKEEEHPAPADSTAVALPTVDHAPIVRRLCNNPPTPFWSDTEVARLLAIPTPPPSPLSLCPTYPLGYRAAMIWLKAEAPSTSHSPLPRIILSHTRADTPPLGTPPLLPHNQLPTYHIFAADLGDPYGAVRPRTRGFRADYGFVATMDMEIRHDLERDVGYGITNTWDEMLLDMLGAPAIDDTKIERQLMAGRLNMLYRDRRAHARTTLLMEREARMSREAWG
ncbi:hypothetical protein Tco_1287636 [Tanacetum coccineum]